MVRRLFFLVAAVLVSISASKPTNGNDNAAINDYVNSLQADALVNRLEADDDVPLTDEEEQVLYELYKKGYLDEPTGEEDEPENEVELELEPSSDEQGAYDLSDDDQAALEELIQRDQQVSEEPEQEASSQEQMPMQPIQVNQEHATPAPPVSVVRKDMHKHKGQAEFETFTDPIYAGASAQVQENPTVNVKRSQDLHFADGGFNMDGNVIFMGVVGICAVVAMAGTVIAGTAYYKLAKQNAAAQSARDMNSISGPAKDRMRRAVARGDQKNAYSAQLHHYQQTKNEIIRIEQQGDQSRDHESDEESDNGEEPDYSVYECPGLAPTGDIEVANPMFDQSNGKK